MSIASSSLLDLASQAPSAMVKLFMKRNTSHKKAQKTQKFCEFCGYSVTQNAIRPQFVHAREAANLIQILPVILGSPNVGIHVFGKTLDRFGMVDIKLQVIRIVVITLKHSGRMGAIRLVDDCFNPVRGNDRLFGISLDVFGRNKLLGNDDYTAACLRLFFILPAGAMNLRISIAVGDLDVDER